MNPTRFDALPLSKRLQSGGFTQQQAEMLAMEVVEMGREDHLVTRDYLDEKLKITHEYLNDRMDGMRAYLNNQIDKATIKTGTMLFIGFGFLASIKFFGA